MSRKLTHLLSVVLVLSLAGRAQAQDADVLIRNPDTAMPVLDGVVDDVWSFSTEQLISIVTEAEPTSPTDCSGSWRALWNWEYLYVLVDVNDEALVQDSDAAQGWLDDRVEVFVDGENNKATATDENDFQYNFRWNHGQVETPVEWYNSPLSLEGVEYAVVTTGSGYLLEIKLPWSTMIGGPPPAGQSIGIDVMIDDDDDGGGRDTQMRWHTPAGDPHNPSLWGTAELVAGNKAGNPSPANGAVHPETWANLGWLAGPTAVSHDIYLGDNLEDVNNGTGETFRGNQSLTSLIVGFPGFHYPDGLVPGTTYYWRIDEINAEGTVYKGDVWSFSIPPKTAYDPEPADGAEFVDPNTLLSWTSGYGARLHTVYLGESYDDVNDATTGTQLGASSYDPGTLERERVFYWRVDEFDTVETHKGAVWAFTTPGAVGNPDPANGEVDVQLIAKPSWTAADNATSHELYFGTDKDAVINATKASPEYVGPRALGAESYDPGQLAWDADYFWRVDEVYPTGTVKGLVWGFETAAFLSVDDFEAYNDIDPPDTNSFRIFDVWIDGFGTTTNGALVGNDLPPYAERGIVHGGEQSMIYRYDNAGKTSEATMTLVWPKDWTQEDVTKLSLWHRGASANAPDGMYVALNGTAVVSHPDPAATNLTGWKQWVIDLADFGVNLSNVNTVTIGVGTKNAPSPAGGTGTLYFDDIRLYR